jgi:AcrR family transcriptional regulator
MLISTCQVMRRFTGRRGRGAVGSARGPDLARELLRAAEDLIADRGPQGFSLREVARRARVSEAAPYWHFPNKEALLAGVAEAGFVALGSAMAEICRRVKDPGRRLQQLGVAYVRFALARPAYLRIMFGPEIPDKAAYPTLKAAGERAFGLLVTAITDAQRGRSVRRGDPEEMAVAAWALVHGLSALLVDGQLKEHARTKRNAERLAGRITTYLQTGLGAGPTSRRPARMRSRIP